MKIYILKPTYDHLYLEEYEYETHEERYEYTKDISPGLIFEEKDLDLAIDKLILANMD
jgi:hypothetical protein